MGSIPVTDETLIEIYRCGTCHKAYQMQLGPVRSHMYCCAAHAPGTCCHYGEIEVSEETLRAVRGTLACGGEQPVAVWDNGDPDPGYSLSILGASDPSSTASDGLESGEV